MSAVLQPIISILIWVISIFVAIRFNRSLRTRDPDLSPYKWGYFLGVFSLLSPINSLAIHFSGSAEELGVNIFGPWQILGLVLSILIGIGLLRRMKLGWWAVFASIAMSPFLIVKNFSSNPNVQEMTSQELLVVMYWVIGVAGVIYAVINVIYARKRWHEFVPVRQSLESR